MAKSKVKKLEVTMKKRDKIVEQLRCYAHHAYGWDMVKEGDYKASVPDFILEVLLEDF